MDSDKTEEKQVKIKQNQAESHKKPEIPF